MGESNGMPSPKVQSDDDEISYIYGDEDAQHHKLPGLDTPIDGKNSPRAARRKRRTPRLGGLEEDEEEEVEIVDALSPPIEMGVDGSEEEEMVDVVTLGIETPIVRDGGE